MKMADGEVVIVRTGNVLNSPGTAASSLVLCLFASHICQFLFTSSTV